MFDYNILIIINFMNNFSQLKHHNYNNLLYRNTACVQEQVGGHGTGASVQAGAVQGVPEPPGRRLLRTARGRRGEP